MLSEAAKETEQKSFIIYQSHTALLSEYFCLITISALFCDYEKIMHTQRYGFGIFNSDYWFRADVLNYYIRMF